jgi:metallophosphoesterase superfamily enzyme
MAGTTPVTAHTLKKNLVSRCTDFLADHTGLDLIFNGDLFDQYNVAMSDVLDVYRMLADWLVDSPDQTLVLGKGNHDHSKDSSQVSSLEFLATVLMGQFPDRVQYVTEPKLIFPGMWMIPHMVNQEAFDVTLRQAAQLSNHTILVHANYDNGFAVESDHSLNVSAEQAEAIRANGNKLIFGHEHQQRWLKKQGIFITGNQWPSSVADCQNNPKGVKYALIVDEAESEPIRVQTWEELGSYVDVDWRELGITDLTGVDFIRVSGETHPEEAGEALNAIAKLRRDHPAFVITNATKVAGQQAMEDAVLSVDAIREFNVLEYLFEQLSVEQVQVVKALLEKSQVRDEVPA